MNRKIFIGYMNTQNISKYYGSKLDVILDNSQFYDFTLVKSTEKSEDNPVDVILDYSEYYDFELSLITNDFDENLVVLTTPIYCPNEFVELVSNGLETEDLFYILTEDDNIILY